MTESTTQLMALDSMSTGTVRPGLFDMQRRLPDEWGPNTFNALNCNEN